MQERPTAQLTALTANMNRDTKKTPKPYHLDDFCLYRDREGHELPDSAYGSAAMLLLKQKRMPPWALFCYKALANSADKDYVPNKAALVAEDVILLHPVLQGTSYTGMMIALESASEQRRVFTDDEGHQIALTVPFVDTKVVAQEGATLER